MSATEVTTRRAGEDSTYTAEPVAEFEPGPVEFRGKPEPVSRSPRERGSVVVREPAQPAPESEQKPALLGLVDRFVELLNALWDRLTSL
jgi:hypothetical protein